MKILVPLIVALLCLACGDESAEVCPEINGEAHLTQARTTPSGMCTMLHILEKSCAQVGVQKFKVYAVADSVCDRAEEEPHVHSGMEDDVHEHGFSVLADADAVGELGDVELVTVDGGMPAHGHGFAESPALDSGNPDRFTATFQMPGEWHVVAELYVDAVTDELQTVQFVLDVQP
jgi:hypothetical protein